MVTLTIDGVEVSVERGTFILQAAEKAGISIPTLCNDKRLIPFGACRLCVVEITQKGRMRTMPACFNPVREGMQVVTQSPELFKSRRLQVQLLLRSHPLLCPSCDACGDCRLQDLVHEYKLGDQPFNRQGRSYHTENDSHFIRHNMNLCIRCNMCVRICDEVQGQNEISMIQRGMHSVVSTDFQRPLACEFCGQCVQVCPVGAICNKWLVGTGREFELTKSDTICSFCSLGCTLTVGSKKDMIVNMSSPPDSPNEGSLCVKGRYGWPYIYSGERLAVPHVKKTDSLEPVEWKDAFQFVSARLKAVKDKYGPQSIAALGSERLTNEEGYLFNKLARAAIGTPHVDHAGGYGYRALVDGIAPVLGYPAGTNRIREIRNSKVILLVGADLYETHPVAKNEVIIATGRHRARAIIIDAIRPKLADRPGLFLGTKPGAEYMVLNAMLKYIIDNELFDSAALALKAEGLDELKASLQSYSADKVSKETGVAADLIEKAAKEYAEAETACIILTQGMNRFGYTVEAARAAANLAVVTGKIGKESCGVHVFGEKANAQGAVDMGLAPDLLPGFKSVDDEAAGAKFEKAWGASFAKEKGFSAAEILAKAESGEIKALYIVGENPLETYPDRDQVEKALSKVELLVVQDMFATATAKKAHAVLPACSFAEKTGTYTSAERLVQMFKPVIPVRAGKSDFEIFVGVAKAMGAEGFEYEGPANVMDEISQLVEPYAGISYDRLEQGGLAWPCVDGADPGKPMLYEGGFPAGKAKLSPAPEITPIKNGMPLYLIPGIYKFHSGSFSNWSSSLTQVIPHGSAEMNSKDISALGLNDGDQVRLTDPFGNSIRLKIKESRRPVPGTVIVPQHYPEIRLNSLVSWGEPVIRVKVEKLP